MSATYGLLSRGRLVPKETLTQGYLPAKDTPVPR
jgi:hypothetical protein